MPRNTIRLRLKPPILDEHVQASVSAVEACDEETGQYGTIHYTGCATAERAKEIKQGLFRAARRQGVSMSATVHPAEDGTFYVEFFAVNKEHARKYVLEKYGKDRQKWPYSPIAGDKNYG